MDPVARPRVPLNPGPDFLLFFLFLWYNLSSGPEKAIPPYRACSYADIFYFRTNVHAQYRCRLSAPIPCGGQKMDEFSKFFIFCDTYPTGITYQLVKKKRLACALGWMQSSMKSMK